MTDSERSNDLVNELPGDSDEERGKISKDGWGNADDNRNPTQPTSPDDLIEEDPMRAPGLDDPEKMISE